MRALQLLILVFGGIWLPQQIGWGAEVIAHPGIPMENINRDQLRAIYALQITRWPDGVPIVVLRMSSSHPLHNQFCTKELGVLPQQLEAVWERLVFTGQGRRPRQVADESDMLNMIARTPGAIGYITERSDDANVKTLPVLP